MPDCYPLVRATDRTLVGGKALALGELLRAGFTIPDGFVISATNDLTTDDKATVFEQFDRLHSSFVAVRSSAVNEDGTTHSWAGQLDTYLHVARDGLLNAIQRCQQSAHSTRATAYAAQNSVASGATAVIVQAMVDSEISGVGLTAHPVTGSSDQLVIEAALGLGEAIVSGSITPDTYIIDRASRNIRETAISTQHTQLIQGEDQGVVWQTLQPSHSKQKLDVYQLNELITTLLNIENYYGFPVDVEWAFTNDKLYILQSRPITAIA